jgi:uracil-DNA glycosylase
LDYLHRIHPSWTHFFSEELEKKYMKDLMQEIALRRKNAVIYPPENDLFSAFRETAFDEVKVVILGQDPYHGTNQAHGLSFSVRRGEKIPPSLRNIYQELKSDLGIETPSHGCLEHWAQEGVLLLNNVLSVEEGKPGSHHRLGWETFTDRVIEILNAEKRNLVFILWGSPAQMKAKHVDPGKHLLIKSVHPSPLSSYRGFFGSKPFTKTNDYLRECGIKEVNWKII